MSDKKLVILGIVAVIMVAWAVVQSRVSDRRGTGPDVPVYLIYGLDPADIDSIVFGSGESTVTLKRQGRSFVVVNNDNYPAEISEINDLLSKCLEIQTEQFITDDAANYEDLEVTEEKARSVVKFLKPDSSLLVGFAIGKDKELGQGAYIRLLPDDKVYVAQNTPWVRTGAMDYIEQELISAKREDIESVTVGSANGEYTLKAEGDGDEIVLADIPAGKKLKDSDSDSVFTALTNLRCDDVKKRSSDLTFDRQYVCILKDSTVYTIKVAQKDDKTYISCKADFTDKTPVLKGDEEESEEELKKKEAKLLARDKAKEFTAKHGPWVYDIADWKAKNLTKELSDLIEDEQEPEETDQTQDPNAVETEDLQVPAVTPVQPNSIEAEP
jgi:hypothetical protein